MPKQIKNIALVTSCSATQSIPHKPDLCGEAMPRNQTAQEALAEWSSRLDKYEPEISPAELYRGIAFNSIVRAKAIVYPENIHIASIGQGLVNLHKPIVPYNLSIEPTHRSSLLKIITAEVFSATYWWQRINEARHSEKHPITALGALEGIDLIIVALSGKFLGMVAEDLMLAHAATASGNAIIRVVTTSTNTSFPGSAKETIIQYDKRLSANTIGNRNDLSQRACIHFLSLYQKKKLAIDATVMECQSAVMTSLEQLGPLPTKSNNSDEIEVSKLQEMLQRLQTKNPNLHLQNPDQIYQKLQLKASILLFRKAWRRVLIKKTPRKEVNALAATEALQSIQASLKSAQLNVVDWRDENEAFEAIQIFVDTLRQTQPDARFTSAELRSWAIEYFKVLQQKLPTILQNAAKASRFLKLNYMDLGLQSLVNQNSATTGGQIYALAPVGAEAAQEDLGLDDDLDLDLDLSTPIPGDADA